MAYTAFTRLRGRICVLCALCVTNGSVPNNLTRIGAESLRDVVTIAKLGTEDKETGGKRSIALMNEPGEENVRLFVDRVRLRLKYHLDGTTEDRESKVDDGNS
jgi:hypothetical protein